MLSRLITRNFSRSAVMRSADPEGFPGANMPFSITNRYRLLGVFIVFFGSGFSLPFFIVRHHMLKA